VNSNFKVCFRTLITNTIDEYLLIKLHSYGRGYIESNNFVTCEYGLTSNADLVTGYSQ